MILGAGHRIAAELILALGPYCERIEVAGGVRRQKPYPHDVELVAVPKYRDVAEGLFDPVRENLLDTAITFLLKGGFIQPAPKHKSHRGEKTFETAAPFSEKLKSFIFLGEKVDLFTVTPPAQWGPIFTIRTGDAIFTHRLVSKGWPRGIYFRDGGLYQHVDLHGRYIPDGQGHPANSCNWVRLEAPEEADVFRILGLDFVPPEKRSLAEYAMSHKEVL